METKSQNHKKVMDQLMNDIKQLKKVIMRYHGNIKKCVPIIVDVLTIAADRPGRDACYRILGHGSNNTKCRLCSDWIFDPSWPYNKFCFPTRDSTAFHAMTPTPPPSQKATTTCNQFFLPDGTSDKYLQVVGVQPNYAMNSIVQKAAILQKEHPNLENCLSHITYPSHWISEIDISLFIGTPMHQLFQGVVKSTIKLSSKWLHEKLKWPEYR
eukprot:12199394-Ditylum_brightwellii.AAC.1